MRIITTYEKAIVGYLGANLKRTKIRLWADAFASDQRARTPAQIFFGLQSVEFGNPAFNPSSGQQVRTKTLKFEVQALIYDLKDHQAALDLMDEAIGVLDNYQPYSEIEPLAPIRYGSPRRNNQDGSWTYAGEMQAIIYSDVANLTPIGEIIESQIVEVGLVNVAVIGANQVDRTWK